MERSVDLACLAVACGCAYKSTHILRRHRPKREHGFGDGRHSYADMIAMAATWYLPIVGLAASALAQAANLQDSSAMSARLSTVFCLMMAVAANALRPGQQYKVHWEQSGYLAASCAAFLAYRCYHLVQDGMALPATEIITTAGTLLGLLCFPVCCDEAKHGKRRAMGERKRSVAGWLLYDWGLHPVVDSLPVAIDIDDVPRFEHAQTAEGMSEALGKTDASKSLEARIFAVVGKHIVAQWLLITSTVTCDFTSSYALYCLLQHMETTRVVSKDTWMLFAGLPLSYLVHSLCDTRQGWIGESRIHLPLLGLLQSLVFEKMTRLRTAGATVDDKESDNKPPSMNDALHTYSEDVASAFQELHRLPFACFKVVLYSVYLSNLLGWKPVAAGSMAAVVSIFVSSSLSASFRTLQSQQNGARRNTSAAISEALTSLRHIRLSSMGAFWNGRLNQVRDAELKLAWKTKVQEQKMNVTASLGPVLFASVALSYAFLSKGRLSSSVAFAALNIFGDLHKVLQMMSTRYTSLHRWRLSLVKLKEYLEQPERHAGGDETCATIRLEDADLGWTSSEQSSKPILHSVNLDISSDALTLITGPVGAGKSLLLSVLLGEAAVLSGTLYRPAASTSVDSSWIIPGSTAYVSQPPWIEDATVRDNILFGTPLDETRYRQTLSACALLQDFSVLSNGDQTMAGQGGSSLSGGQKWRVALARALYSTAQVLVLEDVISAVDAPIARHICDKALQGELASGRTIILATHRPEYCAAYADCIVTVRDGTVSVVRQETTKSTAANIEEPAPLPQYSVSGPASDEPTSTTRKPTPESPDYWKILYAYVDLGGSLYSFIFSALITICYRILAGSTSWWLAKWTSRSAADNTSQWLDVAVYMTLTISSTMLVSIQALLFTRIGHDSSTVLFNRLTERLLKAKLSWIDATPAGQIIRTLNSDMYAINHRMAPQVIGMASSVAQIAFVCFSSFATSYYAILPAIVLIPLYIRISRQSLRVGTKLRPHLTTCGFPASNLAVSVEGGLATIRAFGRTDHYIQLMRRYLDDANAVYVNISICHQWLSSRVGLISAAFVSLVAAGAIYTNKSAATTGLAVTLALKLNHSLGLTIGQINVMRTGFNAVERVLMLAQLPAESSQGKAAPQGWPSNGAITVDNATVRYDNTESDALKGVSFSVYPGRCVGIVGRTGAGKTSLTGALLRFVPLAEGAITIDGQDISGVRIGDLRKAIRVIPQDPFLFSGSLRQNVDPEGKHSDEKLVSALARVHFKADQDTSAVLDMAIQSGGSNLSHGQLQLLCLARVLLEEECRILILDEATSGVDGNTDKLVQDVIRNSFADTTVLVIAHKISTVADFDQILVLSEGQVAENGSPRELLAKKGQFWDMVQRSENAADIERMVADQGN